MRTCNRCQKQIEFRVVNGQAIPFHLDGHCDPVSAGWKNLGTFAKGFGVTETPRCFSPRGWSDDICYPTTCPECKHNVFFLRHNGGSVWVDPPLGWPWPKHGCIYERGGGSGNDGGGHQGGGGGGGGGDIASIFSVRLGALGADGGSSDLGVVGRAAVYERRRFSVLQIHLLDGGLRMVGLDGLHNDLVGEIVFLFSRHKRLYLATSDGLVLSVSAESVTDPFQGAPGKGS